MNLGKFLVLITFLGISGSIGLAQADSEPSVLDPWRYAVSRSLPTRSPEERNRAASDALLLSEKVLVAQGVLFERARIQNVEYDVFHLLPDSRPRAHRINQVAAELDRTLRGLNLVYAPTVLMGGTAGFYSPKDHVMGISHEFLEKGTPDSTYFHELVHVSHAVARSEGKLDPLSPSAKVVKAAPGIRLSYHSKGYSRLQTFEEIEAHVLKKYEIL
jgi:hypothetical protein